jgi:hypothetical protein
VIARFVWSGTARYDVAQLRRGWEMMLEWWCFSLSLESEKEEAGIRQKTRLGFGPAF